MKSPHRKSVVAPEWYTGHRYRGRYALEYRVVAEKMIGRPLERNEVVHHIDGNTDNNSESNLQVMTVADHASVHKSWQKTAMVELVCPVCGQYFTRRKSETFLNPKRCKTSTCSRKCMGRMFSEHSGIFINQVLREFLE